MDKLLVGCKILEPANWDCNNYQLEMEVPAAAANDSNNNNGCCRWRWWSKEMVTVVTGANKGIGFALVKRLAELGLTVVLTARDEEKGAEALDSLKKLGLADNVELFGGLDVSEPDSIAAFASWLQHKHGGVVDILVNNAGTSTSININHADAPAEAAAAAAAATPESVIRTNFYGPKLLIEALFPMLVRSRCARILNMSSRLGSLNKLRDLELRAAMEDLEQLSEEKITGMLDLFLSEGGGGGGVELAGERWPVVWTDYSVSKLALNAYSKLLARRFKHHGIAVNCFCPGFTQTSMTRGKGTHTPDHAAAIAATLALLPPHPRHFPTGLFFLAPTPLTSTTRFISKL